MTALQKWSSFGEMERFRPDFDNMFDRLAKIWNWGAGFAPPIDSYVEGDKLRIRADLPGVDPKDVEVTVSGNMLTIRGKREHHQERKDQGWLQREVAYGSFERTLALPRGVKADDIEASYRNGVVELIVPLPASEMGRKVPIELADSGAKQIGANGSAQNTDAAKAA